MKFRLKVGQHIGPDVKAKADKNGRRPSKTFTAGQVVDSDVNLVEKFGHEKFEMIGGVNSARGTGNTTPGDPTPENLLESAATFPHGQVSTGFQQTGGGVTRPEDGVQSGPVDPDEAEEKGLGAPVPTDKDREEGRTQGGQADKSTGEHPKGLKISAPQQQAASDKEKQALNRRIDGMSPTDLRKMAEEEEVDLKGATKKEDMARILKQNLVG